MLVVVQTVVDYRKWFFFCVLLGLIGLFSIDAYAIESGQVLELFYDDRYTFDCDVKEIIQGHTVLEADGHTITAIDCGSAQVKLITGQQIEVVIKKAPINLLLIIGQSNAEGERSRENLVSTYHKQTILCKEGQVYSTYAPAKDYAYKRIGGFSKVGENLSIENANSFIPNSITDNTSSKEWCRTNNLTKAAGTCSKLGFDSALAYEWNTLTNEKVYIINAAEGNTSITSWIPGNKKRENNFWQAVELYKRAVEVVENDSHYYIHHQGYFWLQGENDKNMPVATYRNYFLQMHNGLREQTSLNFAAILSVRAGMKYTCKADFAMNGPRTAQKDLTNERDDIYLASTVSDKWTSNKVVKQYFKDTYTNNKTYHKENPMKDKKVKMPSTVDEVHNTLHYEQLGYNEIGKDAAKNMVEILYQGKVVKIRRLELNTKGLEEAIFHRFFFSLH